MLQRERLRTLRLKHQLSQGALGQRIGKDGQYVSKLERGVLAGLTAETLERLADVLGCTTDYLLGRTARQEAGALDARPFLSQAVDSALPQVRSCQVSSEDPCKPDRRPS